MLFYNYFNEQFNYLEIPNTDKFIVEQYRDEDNKTYYILFHSLYGRRVNDVLS